MTFKEELEELINRHSLENGSNTPDFMLADYMLEQLAVWDRFVKAREKWYGRENVGPGALPPNSTGSPDLYVAAGYRILPGDSF